MGGRKKVKASVSLFLLSLWFFFFILCRCEGSQQLFGINKISLASKNVYSATARSKIFYIPRGGAFKAIPTDILKSNTQDKYVVSSISGGYTGEQVIDDLSITAIAKGRRIIKDALYEFLIRFKERRRRGYLISLAISLVYLYYFLTQEPPASKQFADGFCVTNMKEVESAEGVTMKLCTDGNSHLWSWFEDVGFGAVAIILPFTKYKGSHVTTTIRICLPLVIIGHGSLHWFMSENQCYFPSTDPGKLDFATDLYRIFVAALTGMMFFMFSDLPQKRSILSVLGRAIAVSIGIIKVTDSKIKAGYGVSTLILSSQLLLSYLGSFHPGKLSTQLVGETFIFPCIVSIIEFLNCRWLHTVGGHFWYDFTLHISVVAALLSDDFALFP